MESANENGNLEFKDALKSLEYPSILQTTLQLTVSGTSFIVTIPGLLPYVSYYYILRTIDLTHFTSCLWSFFLSFSDSRFAVFFLLRTNILITDTLTVLVACNMQNSSDSTSDCVVVYGKLTLFVDEEQAVQEQPRIENLIKENMNSGIYDDASEEIVRLHYLESSPDPTESNIGDGSDGTGRAVGGKTQNSLRMGLFIGLGALVAVLAGVVFRTSRRMKHADDQTDMQSGGIQTYLDVDAQQQQSQSFS